MTAAVKALHERETPHRDISLRNILLSDEEKERKGLLIDLDYEFQAGKKIADLYNRTVRYIESFPVYISY